MHSKQGTSLMAQLVKNPPAMKDTWAPSLGWEDPLEKRMATHSNTLAWRIPRTEEPGGGSQRVTFTFTFMHALTTSPAVPPSYHLLSFSLRASRVLQLWLLEAQRNLQHPPQHQILWGTTGFLSSFIDSPQGISIPFVRSGYTEIHK